MKLTKAAQNQTAGFDNTFVRKRSDSFDATEPTKNQPRRSASLQEISMESRGSISDDSVEIYEDWRNKVKQSSQLQAGGRNRRAANSIFSKHNPEYSRSDIKLLSNGYESPKFSHREHVCI